MKNILNLLQKFRSKVKRDGIFKAFKKGFVKLYYSYLIKFNFVTNLRFRKHRSELLEELNTIFAGNYDRIIIWRSSIGWSIPLFQRPQQLALEFAKKNTLVFFEVTRLTDKINFYAKVDENLYLVDYSCKKFSHYFHELLNNIDTPHYLFTASTCWDLSDKVVSNYISKGYRFLYDYLDELSPELAGTDNLPYNVSTIHNFVINNPIDTYVLCTADTLLKDMYKKRKSKKNILYVSNGVDYNHFTNISDNFIYNEQYQNILNENKPIIGYYGALAGWIDYDLVKYVADNKKDCNIVLIGAKYDTSFDKAGLENYSNIHFLGPIDYKELPQYASKFDVCILPFLINDITRSTNPIKVFEYMSLSKPIVSTDLNECRKYKPILIGKNHKDFLNRINKALKGLDDKYYKDEKEVALQNTWKAKVSDIIDGLEKYEKKYPFLKLENVTIAKILYKLYTQSGSYNVSNQIMKSLTHKKKTFIVTMNSEICMHAMKDVKYQNIVMDDNILLVPDSISISYAIKKVFGVRIKRYPGIELLSNILVELNNIGGSIYLFGATEKVNNDMQNVIKKKYPNISIIGACNGYVDDYSKVEKEILKLKPDLTVVALGVPAQELFISKVYDKAVKGMFIGVGGSLDVLSGNKKRAPLFMRKINLEWLYRITTDPKRIKRFYTNNIKFISDVRKDK